MVEDLVIAELQVGLLGDVLGQWAGKSIARDQDQLIETIVLVRGFSSTCSFTHTDFFDLV